MIITLYKDCILDKDHKEVMDNNVLDSDSTTAFERYLTSLTKFTITLSENVYITNAGRFPVTLELSNTETLYNYNYMKVTDDYATKYYFIDSIDKVDDSALISYTEDIWVNYEFTFRRSHLIRSKFLKYGANTIPFYKLPINYEGNNNLSISTLGNTNSVTLILEVQTYQASSLGDLDTLSHRTTGYYQIKVFDQQDQTSKFYYSTGSGYDQAYINDIIQEISSSQLYSSDSSLSDRNFYYDVTNIYIVPYIITNGLEQSTLKYTLQSSWTSNIYYFYENTLNTSLYNTNSITISNDFKNLYVGVFSNLIKLNANGTDIPVKLYMHATTLSFGLYMGVQNKLVDLTNDFQYNYPISVESNESTQLKRLTNDFSKLNSIVNIFTTAINAGSGRSLQLGNAVGSLENYIMANADYYTISKSVEVKSTPAILNSQYGLIQVTITPDNSSEVNNAIKYEGYVVDEYISPNDYDIFNPIYATAYAAYFNVVRFENAIVTGACSQNIRLQLANILNKGVKIWYNETGVTTSQ